MKQAQEESIVTLHLGRKHITITGSDGSRSRMTKEQSASVRKMCAARKIAPDQLVKELFGAQTP